MSSRTARAVIQRNHASKINKRRKEGKKERKKERKERKEKKTKAVFIFFLFLCQVIYFNFSFSFKIVFAAAVFRKKCWTM